MQLRHEAGGQAGRVVCRGRTTAATLPTGLACRPSPSRLAAVAPGKDPPERLQDRPLAPTAGRAAATDSPQALHRTTDRRKQQVGTEEADREASHDVQSAPPSTRSARSWLPYPPTCAQLRLAAARRAKAQEAALRPSGGRSCPACTQLDGAVQLAARCRSGVRRRQSLVAGRTLTAKDGYQRSPLAIDIDRSARWGFPD